MNSYLKFFKTDISIVLILFLITIFVYTLSFRGEGAHWNYFILLADAFLHGRLYLLNNPPWLNELINWQGKFYVVYPPMPGILLMPFVAIFGTNFLQPILSILIGSFSVGLSYLVFLKVLNKKNLAIWMSLLFGFGTIYWYHAEVGSAWYIAHIIAVFFIWLAVLETLTKKRLFLIGILIGLAYLSRLPTILAIIFPVIFLHEQFIVIENRKIKKISFKNFLKLGLGLGIFIAINFLYNYLRYGTIEDISYRLLPIFNEPWYKNGLFSVLNIQIHLKEILTSLPKFQDTSPFVIPSINVLALWFTTPALILAFFADFRKRITVAALLTALIISLPDLMHGSNGFTQFGYRFSLDFLPFLLILVAMGLKGKMNFWKMLLIILSILINLWGVVMISILGIWIL